MNSALSVRALAVSSVKKLTDATAIATGASSAV